MSEFDPRLPYTVRGERRNGSVTFLCQNAPVALSKLKAFQHSEYSNITVTGPNGCVTEQDLHQTMASETILANGGPIDLDVPTAPELVG